MVLDCGGDDDLSFWGDSDDKLDSSLDLDREWQRRHDQFHTVFVLKFWNQFSLFLFLILYFYAVII